MSPPSPESQRPSVRALRASLVRLVALRPRTPHASPFLPAPQTPDHPPWDYVHASLGFMDVERGAKEGLVGTSGFSDGVRFSPDLVSEL